MTHPPPNQGHETPINRIKPPTDGQPQQGLPPEEPYLHPEIQQTRLFLREAWKQVSLQFGLDQMTPAQRKRWLVRTGLVFVIAILVVGAIGTGGSAGWLLGFAVLIGLVFLIRWTFRRLRTDRQRAAERVRRVNDQDRRP